MATPAGLAVEKDAGYDPEVFLDALRAFTRLKPEQFVLPSDEYARLRDRVRAWIQDLDASRNDPRAQG